MREGFINFSMGCLFLTLTVNILAQQSAQPPAPTQKATPPSFDTGKLQIRDRPKGKENGITVGKTKIFDQRGLLQMLRDIERSLASAKFFNADKVAGAIGNVQGSSASQTSASFKANLLLPTKTVEDTTTATTKTGSKTPAASEESAATAGKEEASKEENVERVSKATRKQEPPQAAEPTTPTPISGLEPFNEIKIGAQDLLSEQMELTYQLVNLRLLLDRAISDRVITEDPRFSAPRLQTVLGFQITVEPQYKDAVAEVELTVTSLESSLKATEAPTIVSLLPRDKTYNVATFTSNANAFGLGAIIQPVALGLSTNSAQSSLYLVRDTDTVALERLPPDRISASPLGIVPPAVRFAWQFRPVLGRRTVEPGLRQVYVMLALPSAVDQPFKGYATARTIWKRFDRKSKRVGEEIGGSHNFQDIGPIEIKSVPGTEEDLRPKITDLQPEDAGGGQVLVNITGHNFFPDTVVGLADVIYTSANGFELQSERRLRFLAPVTKLVLADASIIGPYGEHTRAVLSKELFDALNYTLAVDEPQSGIVPNDGSMSHVIIVLKKEPKPPFPNAPLMDDKTKEVQSKFLNSSLGRGPIYIENPKFPFVVSIGDSVFGLSDAPVLMSRNEDSSRLKIEFDIETVKLRNNQRAVIQRLLGGRENILPWRYSLPQDFSVSRVVVLSNDNTKATLGIIGTELDEKITCDLGQKTTITGNQFATISKTLLTFDVDLPVLNRANHVVIRRGDIPPVVIKIGAEEKPFLKAEIEKIDPTTEGDVGVAVEVKGKHLDSVKEVKFGTHDVPFAFNAEKKRYELTIIQELGTMPGKKGLTFILTDDKSKITATIEVMKR